MFLIWIGMIRQGRDCARPHRKRNIRQGRLRSGRSHCEDEEMTSPSRRTLLLSASAGTVLVLALASAVFGESPTPDASSPLASAEAPSAQPTAPTPDGWTGFVQAMGSSPVTLVAGLAVLVCVWVIGYGQINRKQKTNLVIGVFGLVGLVVLASFFSDRQKADLDAAKVRAEIAASAAQFEAQLGARYAAKLQDCQSTLGQLRVLIEEKLKPSQDPGTVVAFADAALTTIDGATICMGPLPTLVPEPTSTGSP